MLAGIESPLEREVYISRTSKKCDIPVQVLKTHIDDILRRNARSQQKREWNSIKSAVTLQQDSLNPEAAKFRKEAKAEEAVICYLLRHPEDITEIEAAAPPEIFITSFNKKAYTVLLKVMKENEQFSFSLLSDDLSFEETGRLTGMEAKNREHPVTKTVFDDCVKVLKNHSSTGGSDMSDDELLKLFRSKKNKNQTS